ncbi:hypothetical protein [Candidatus Oleimmundimicrobium sp.]|uniref:hypothetical protein n=1 Tax=Candidatus Oleimmundimicrobium sp. TaxID=3060597 RepID=UPI0027203421|nr:hypothetical protein [Candidatus Oleimmundimicrobium sp.]MDO8885652.1 hypothetical protein [Candidatus Oleimmundimicrobium sp.]
MPLGSDSNEYSILHIDIRNYSYYSGTLSSWLDVPSEKALNRLSGHPDKEGYYQRCEKRLPVMAEYTELFYEKVQNIYDELKKEEEIFYDRIYAGDGIYYALLSNQHGEETIKIPIDFLKSLSKKMPEFFLRWNQKLERKNLSENNLKLDFAIAVHYGYLSKIKIPPRKIHLSNEQMDTLIGPAINIVSKVEKLSKLFSGVKIVITEKFFKEIPKDSDYYESLEELSSERVNIEGLSEPLKLYTFKDLS